MNLNLNLVFLKSMNLNLIFLKSMNLNLNLKIKKKKDPTLVLRPKSESLSSPTLFRENVLYAFSEENDLSTGLVLPAATTACFSSKVFE